MEETKNRSFLASGTTLSAPGSGGSSSHQHPMGPLLLLHPGRGGDGDPALCASTSVGTSWWDRLCSASPGLCRSFCFAASNQNPNFTSPLPQRQRFLLKKAMIWSEEATIKNCFSLQRHPAKCYRAALTQVHSPDFSFMTMTFGAWVLPGQCPRPLHRAHTKRRQHRQN